MAERRRRAAGGGGEQGQSGPGPSDTGSGEFHSSNQIRTGLIRGTTFHHRAVQYAVVDGQAIFEGDIVLGTEEQVARNTEQLRAEATGQVAAGVVITGSQFRWPNCRIPFTIDATLPDQQRVTDAIAHWQQHTSYRFVARTAEADYVTFQPSTGCSSAVGRQGGQQFVNLGSSCSTGNAIHEIGHVVGLWHEQSRADRDTFVTIHWDKIQPGLEHNFDQHITDGDDVGTYDYGSIMHYPRNAFSIDGGDTITPVDPAAQIGQRTALSAGDIAAAASICQKPIKETVKDVRKDGVQDTSKELIKDIRFDTRKELISDTRKELILDTQKEVLKDPIKEGAFDPPFGKGPAVDPLGPGTPTVQPGPVGPGSPLGPITPGALPFAVATQHQAPSAAGAPGDLEATATQLDSQLQILAEQLLQLDASRSAVQAQYDQTAALLKQTLDAHDQAVST